MIIMNVRIILVEPKSEENIGAVARVLKNFAFSDFVLIHPPNIRKKAMSVASHAYDVLKSGTIVDSIQKAIENSDIVAGTTSKPGISENRHVRMPFFSPKQLKEKVKGKSGTLSILFGREDTGLRNEELVLCDIVVSIPANPDYPVMNVSHAVAVMVYELSDVDADMDTASLWQPKLASIEDKERLFSHVRTFLDEIEYREYKKEKTMLMLRRIVGRAELTGREVRTLRGIIAKAEWKIGIRKYR
jgi:TrmH family RNA methyltransferase